MHKNVHSFKKVQLKIRFKCKIYTVSATVLKNQIKAILNKKNHPFGVILLL